jgi:predicted Fe-Mo cluster-binding NifX family protein
MRVAITAQGPGLTSEIEPRFGCAHSILVLDTATGVIGSRECGAGFDTARDAERAVTRSILKLGVDAVITGSIGPEAIAMLQAGNIQVHTTPSRIVKDAVARFEETPPESGKEPRGELYYWT